MQKIMGYLRKAIQEYDMIAAGDRVAVGVSGGKDSVALLAGLAGVRGFLGIPFDLVAITLDPGWDGKQTDYTQITELCRSLGLPHEILRTEIGPIVFESREETNPCSLCARMRRGALHDAAKANDCNKIALGHHYNDAVETFIMNLFMEGRVGCFSPVTYLSRKDLTMIRPLVFAPEKDITSAVRRNDLPVQKSGCPVDGSTTRQWAKDWLRQMEKTHPGITQRIFGAMRRGHISGW